MTLEELKKENETLKQKLNPLSEKENVRLGELHNLIASTLSSHKDFEKLKKEYLELSSRVTNDSVLKGSVVSNAKKIGG